MDECELYAHLLSKIGRSKDDFLDWFEHLFEIDGRHEDLYEIVVSWEEEKTREFVKWFDWNIDKIRFRIWRFDREYPRYIVVETEKNPVFAGQSFSEKNI